MSIKLKTYMLPEQKLVELQQATKDDTVLQELKKAVKTGWPAMSTRYEVLKPHLQFKDELLVEDGLILIDQCLPLLYNCSSCIQMMF